MKYISRHIEETLINCQKTFPVTLLIGPRQVGKSATLENVFPNLPYITFDDSLLLNVAKQDVGLFFQTKTPPIVIDEVQYAPAIFPFIKLICDRKNLKGYSC